MILRHLGVDTLVLVGVCTDVCVLWTTGDAYQRDYRVYVVEDCVAGTSQAGQEAALATIRALTNAGRPVTFDAVKAALGRHALALTGARHASA